MQHPLWIVDVFAERRYAGNQLAVVLDAEGVSEARMQEIAREMNFSETSFVTREEGKPPRVRIFTPAVELPFAGHPTLGTSWVLRREAADAGPAELTLDLPVGPTRTWVDGDGVLWMRQRDARFGPVADAAEAAMKLGLAAEDAAAGLPCQQVDTGVTFLLLALRDKDALARAYPTPELAAFVRERRVEGVMAFCLGGHTADGDLAARMFAPEIGVREDAATGSAGGCLAAYMSRHEALGSPTLEARLDQGYEMGRPSRLYLRARKEGASVVVEVGGRVQPVARGVLL